MEEVIQDKKQNILTVTQLTSFIKNLIDYNDFLSFIYLSGEVSNLKKHTSGHYYFNLKDQKSQISCVMFAGNAKKIKFDLKDGMKVIATGRVSVYERSGSYQLYVDSLKPEGLGELYLAFLQLKEKLEKEGLFDESRKKPLPYFPRVLGVVSSETGAVIHDILTTIKNRNNSVKVILAPSKVQGEDAPPSIVKAIERLNRLSEVEIIIVARGGGSLEDLMAFNSEEVARAIFSSGKPVVSAVGHETDFTIADFVSSRRAPTPTGAAQVCVPDKFEMFRNIENLKSKLKTNLLKKIDYDRKLLERLRNSYIFRNPFQKINLMYQDLDRLTEQLYDKIKEYFRQQREKIKFLKTHLKVLNPYNILDRGYGIITDKKSKKVIKSVNDVKKNDLVLVQVSDGEFESKVL
ncbi:MAG: exodeoxyribonuclease VII large subunit [Armatimonadota bacterium]